MTLPGTRLAAAAAVAMLLVGVLLRASDIDADPPKDLSWSQGLHTDGAVVVQNARNQALWGKPVLDYGIDMYWFPLSYAATFAAFKLFGVSTAAARGTSIVFGMASVAAACLALGAARGERRGLVAAILLGASFPLAMYHRLPLAEPAMILLMALAFLFFALGSERGSTKLLAAAGFFAVAAPLFGKAHAAYLPAACLAAMLSGSREERSRARLVALFAGFGGALVAWGLLLVLPHGREIVAHYLHESLVKHETSPGGRPFLVEALDNAISMGAAKGLGFLARDPITITLGFAAIPLLAMRWARSRRAPGPAARLAGCWLLLGWAFLACVKFPAPRYLTALFIPCAVLAAEILFPGGSLAAPPRAAEAGTAGGPPHKKRNAPPKTGDSVSPRVLAGVFAAALLAAVVTLAHAGTLGVPFPFLDAAAKIIPGPRASGYPWSLLVPGALLAAGLTALLARGRGVRPPPAVLGAILVGVAVLGDGVQFAAWRGGRTHTVVEASRRLGELLGDGAHLVGAYAPALTLENRFRSSPYFGPEYMGPDHDPDLFAHYGITHVVLAARGDFETMKSRYPDVARGLVPVASLPFNSLWADAFHVFRVPSEIGGRRIHDYVPTPQEQAAEATLAGKGGAPR